MKNILLVLTNWKRRHYLESIVKKIREQNIEIDVIIVDNASNLEDYKVNFDLSNFQKIEKENTEKCWERWKVIFERINDYKYVCVMDDDLNLKTTDFFSECLNYMEKNTHIDCIGKEGVIYKSNMSYATSEHYFPHPNTDKVVQIIKGRFMFIRSESLKNQNPKPDPTCDDIVISSCLKHKLIPSFFYDKFEDLIEGNEALSRKSFQQQRREVVSRMYFT